MLQKLHIQNYAIIDELAIVFSGNLNVITGETGAGKSIIVGALGLILGERADTSVLVNKDRKCIVEGVFGAEDKKAVHDFLLANELDIANELVVRRETATNGKSRAFINDTPVNLSQLHALSSLLVDLHQQFDSLELGESDFQRQVIDALAKNDELLHNHRSLFHGWQQANNEWRALLVRKQQFDKEAGYDQFQYEELAEANFQASELEQISSQLRMLEQAEAIKEALNKVYFELKESETPVVSQLKIWVNQLGNYSAAHPDVGSLVERLRSAQVELQDIASELDRFSSQVDFDPEKIVQLNERLSLGYRLQKKHGVQSTNELLSIQKQLEEKLRAVLDIDAEISEKEKQADERYQAALVQARKISGARQKQVRPFEEKVNDLLAQVGMPNAKIKVAIGPAELNEYGTDTIEFLFNANLPATQRGKNEDYLPVRKVASGGELSRLMLCIKSLVARTIDLPTLIFDEIDTGISGEAARQVGKIMKDLALQRQVICITHQPQIAGKADAHFFVYKEIVKDAVKTNIRQLTMEERITAIARMLSGEKPTAAAIENAREMMN
jgi:DNA repair protein RecN (Recombination protein N)